MSWETNRIDLGTVKQNSTIRFSFHSLYPLEIDRVIPGCGCTKVAPYEDGVLSVTYKPGSLPKHLVRRIDFQAQSVVKTIRIIYKDNKQEKLYFTAKIIK